MKSATLHHATRRTRDWLTSVVAAALVVAGGIVLGMQYMNPNKRVLASLGAAVVFGIAWRLDLVSGLGLLVLALPFPRITVFGSTNLALVLVMLVIWLLRSGQGAAAGPRRTPVDIQVAGLLGAYVISFYNVANLRVLGLAMTNFVNMLACVALFYLVVSSVRKPSDLARLHVFQCISVGTVFLLALFELNFPGRALVPGWIEFGHRVGEGVQVHNVRIGGPFFDFEQLSDYCAVNLMLLLFLVLRRGSTTRRVVCAGMFALAAFVLFTTVTRGAILALAAGIVYFAWIARRRISFVAIVLTCAAIVLGIGAMNFYVSHFTFSGDLLGRLADPGTMKFVHGLPQGRAETWSDAFGRMLAHPIIGHGPYYEIQRGTKFWYWPHNLYLYLGNLIGFFGLGWFLWLMWKFLRMSWVKDPDWNDPNYARAFLPFAHIQLVVFAIDQLKIEYLRNPIYMFQVWLMFAGLVAAHLNAGVTVPARSTAPAPASRAAAPLPAARSPA